MNYMLVLLHVDRAYRNGYAAKIMHLEYRSFYTAGMDHDGTTLACFGRYFVSIPICSINIYSTVNAAGLLTNVETARESIPKLAPLLCSLWPIRRRRRHLPGSPIQNNRNDIGPSTRTIQQFELILKKIIHPAVALCSN